MRKVYKSLDSTVVQEKLSDKLLGTVILTVLYGSVLFFISGAVIFGVSAIFAPESILGQIGIVLAKILLGIIIFASVMAWIETARENSRLNRR